MQHQCAAELQTTTGCYCIRPHAEPSRYLCRHWLGRKGQFRLVVIQPRGRHQPINARHARSRSTEPSHSCCTRVRVPPFCSSRRGRTSTYMRSPWRGKPSMECWRGLRCVGYRLGSGRLGTPSCSQSASSASPCVPNLGPFRVRPMRSVPLGGLCLRQGEAGQSHRRCASRRGSLLARITKPSGGQRR